MYEHFSRRPVGHITHFSEGSTKGFRLSGTCRHINGGVGEEGDEHTGAGSRRACQAVVGGSGWRRRGGTCLHPRGHGGEQGERGPGAGGGHSEEGLGCCGEVWWAGSHRESDRCHTAGGEFRSHVEGVWKGRRSKAWPSAEAWAWGAGLALGGGGAAPPSLPLSHFLPFDLHLLECSFRSSSLAGACFAPFPPVRSSSLLCIPAASLKPVLSDDV